MSLTERISISWERDPRRVVVLGFGLVFLAGLLLIIVSALFNPQPKIILAGAKQAAVSPVIIKFPLPPDRQNISINIVPKTSVSSEWTGGVFGHFSRTLVISPETSWQIDQNYQIVLSGIDGAINLGSDSRSTFSFTVQKLPEVKTINIDKATDVAVDSDVVIDLSQPTEGVAEFVFQFSPSVEFMTTVSGNSYQLKFTSNLRQGQKYQMQVFRRLIVVNQQTQEVEKRLEKEMIYQMQFTTLAPLLVESFSPQGNSVLPTEKEIAIDFTEKIIRPVSADKIRISPAVAGSWQWVSDSRIVFRSTKDLPIDTQFLISLAKGISATDGSYLDKDESLKFKTVGALKVLSTNPANGELAVGLAETINLRFDQPIVEASLAGRVKISPAMPFTYSLKNNQLLISAKNNFDYFQVYRITLASGVQTVFGKPLSSNFTFSFTTEQKRVVLNIALDYQDRALSCEAAALKMALNYYGLSVTESAIMAEVGYDPTIKSGSVWGDPNTAFVGNIDGSQNSTGYGVHWGPIARSAKKWRSASAFTNWTASRLAQAINDRHPVVIWGVLGNAYYDPWKTPGGTTIAAWKGEHARTVIGYTGSVKSPTSFIINDPIAGRITWSTSTLLNNWGTFSNSGVVVY